MHSSLFRPGDQVLVLQLGGCTPKVGGLKSQKVTPVKVLLQKLNHIPLSFGQRAPGSELGRSAPRPEKVEPVHPSHSQIHIALFPGRGPQTISPANFRVWQRNRPHGWRSRGRRPRLASQIGKERGKAALGRKHPPRHRISQTRHRHHRSTRPRNLQMFSWGGAVAGGLGHACPSPWALGFGFGLGPGFSLLGSSSLWLRFPFAFNFRRRSV